MLKAKIYLTTLVISTFGFGQIEQVKELTKTLCSPEFHGRGYVYGGDSIAAEFIANEFRKAGLQTLPKYDSYFQRFSFPVNTFPGVASFTQNGKTLEIGKDILPDPACPKFTGTLKIKKIHASLILDEESLMTEIQAVISGSEYNCIAIDYQHISADTMKLVGGFKYQLAQFIPVIAITDKKFTWSVSGEQLKYPVFELKADSYVDNANIEVKLFAKLIEKHTARNVIAYLPAKKKSKKTIFFTAHYDHLGRLGEKTYFPGANDNASGTAMIISLAHYFTKNPIDYNIVFIAFAGEEAGLIGSKYFVDNPLFKLKNIDFLINLDIMGSGEDGITVVNGSIYEDHFNLLTEINAEKKYLTQIKKRGYAANSDHYWFSDAGVPAIFIYTMGSNSHYHDIFDTHEELTFAEYEDITMLLSNFVEKLPGLQTKKVKREKK